MSHSGMPQLDVATYPSQLFWLAITFIALYALMKWLALPKVATAIEARRNRLEGDLAGAETLRSEAESVLAAYQKALAEARGEAQARLRETQERLAAEAAARQRQIADDLAGRIAAAEGEIAAARQRAVADLRTVALDVAASLSEKLTGRPPEPANVASAVDAVLAERPVR